MATPSRRSRRASKFHDLWIEDVAACFGLPRIHWPARGARCWALAGAGTPYARPQRNRRSCAALQAIVRQIAGQDRPPGRLGGRFLLARAGLSRGELYDRRIASAEPSPCGLHGSPRLKRPRAPSVRLRSLRGFELVSIDRLRRRRLRGRSSSLVTIFAPERAVPALPILAMILASIIRRVRPASTPARSISVRSDRLSMSSSILCCVVAFWSLSPSPCAKRRGFCQFCQFPPRVFFHFRPLVLARAN